MIGKSTKEDASKKRRLVLEGFIKFTVASILILGLFGVEIGFGKKRGTPRPITNVFFETDIREALRDISAQSGVTIIPDDTVQGVVTLELDRVPFEECLKMVLMGGGFTYKKIDDYYLVGAAVHDSPTFDRLSETRHIRPDYIKAKDVPLYMPEFFTDYIHVNEEMNTLTIIASPEMIARIEGDIAKIDIPPKQIMIQALITDITKGSRKELGIDWEWQWDNTEGIDSTASGTANMTDLLGTFTYTTTGELTRKLMATINLLIREGKIKVRANPRLVTIDGQEATIFIGREQYYSIVSGPVNYPYTTLEAITAGITLKITPYIASNGDITIEVEPEVSEVNIEGSESGLPIILKRQVSTKVRVKDGDTVVIGGLTHQNEFERVSRIPILGYIPIVNLFFMDKKKVVEETEVVVFITPTILSNGMPQSQKTEKIEEGEKIEENE